MLLISFILLSGCYTTFYPPANQNFDTASEIPDSARQVIINNYYETTKYYQTPNYQRYSLLWGSYYWDPFYYDYGYYHWEPYYWHGSYYYYNPRNRYWYYHDPYYRWHDGSWTGGTGGGQQDQGRIQKPGYRTLMNTSSGGETAPFVSVGNENNSISKPGTRSGIDINSGINNTSGQRNAPKIESLGKRSNVPSDSFYKKDGNDSNKKPSSTSTSSRKPSYRPSTSSSSSSSSSSSGNTKSKSSSTTRSTSKNSSSNESSSSTSKKSK